MDLFRKSGTFQKTISGRLWRSRKRHTHWFFRLLCQLWFYKRNHQYLRRQFDSKRFPLRRSQFAITFNASVRLISFWMNKTLILIFNSLILIFIALIRSFNFNLSFRTLLVTEPHRWTVNNMCVQDTFDYTRNVTHKIEPQHMTAFKHFCAQSLAHIRSVGPTIKYWKENFITFINFFIISYLSSDIEAMNA